MKIQRDDKIRLADGVRLRIYPDDLEAVPPVSARMDVTKELVRYEFGPTGIRLARPVELKINRQVFDSWDLANLTLYGEDGEAIQPAFRNCSVVYGISHFSLYYHRRRRINVQTNGKANRAMAV